MTDSIRLPRGTPPALSFVAGYVDTVGFVALFSLFAAHVTGNFVVIGASFVDPRPGMTTKILALPTFILVVALARLAIAALGKTPVTAARGALLAQALFLILFMAAGLRVGAISAADADSFTAMSIGLLAVAAMAIQNAASRLAFPDLAPTTVMTGNVTQLVIDVVDLVRGSGDRAVIGARARKMWPSVLGFAAGAAGGAVGYRLAGFGSIALPLVIVIGVALAIRTGSGELK